MWDELSDNVVAEYDDGVLTASYTHEPGRYGSLISQNRSGTTHYYHFDGRGDTVALTNDAGTITDTKDYDAWGNVIAEAGSTQSLLQFVGKLGARSDAIASLTFLNSYVYNTALSRLIGIPPFAAFASGRSVFASFLPEFDELETKCSLILQATMAGWKLVGNNCAFDLMQASFSRVAATCPDSCVDSIKARGFDYIRFCAKEAFETMGECGMKNEFRFHTKGSHALTDPGIPKVGSRSDLFYSLGKFEWSAEGYCNWDCKGRRRIFEEELQCCECDALCGFQVVITDTYDFAPPPAQPPLILGPIYCAQLLFQKGRLSKVTIHCPIREVISQQRFSGHRCDWCRRLVSDDPALIGGIPPKRRPYDPTSGEGYCPGTAEDADGNIIFRSGNERRIYY